MTALVEPHEVPRRTVDEVDDTAYAYEYPLVVDDEPVICKAPLYATPSESGEWIYRACITCGYRDRVRR